MNSYHLDHLQYLETEAIHIMREVAARIRAARAALLRRQGFHLPAAPRGKGLPPVGHSDAVPQRRHRPPFSRAERIPRPPREGARRASSSSARSRTPSPTASRIPRPARSAATACRSPTLLAAIEEFRFDCCIGGARRDEEKARAKERFFSFRDSFGQWDPKNQRPEIWNLYNARLNPGENMRVFPLTNWTEMDVWEYIKREKLEVPTHLFQPHAANASAAAASGCRSTTSCRRSRTRRCSELVVRVRTIGDIISTGMVESPADTVDDIIAEIAAARVTERGSRADDKASEAAMEDRKKAGYF